MLQGVIGAFATGTYSVTRTTAATLVAGRIVAGMASSFSISASVQPVEGRDLLAMPEGLRSEETRVVYTTTELRTLTEGHGADVVTIDGDLWTVDKVERWQAFGEQHYRAFVARQATS